MARGEAQPMGNMAYVFGSAWVLCLRDQRESSSGSLAHFEGATVNAADVAAILPNWGSLGWQPEPSAPIGPPPGLSAVDGDYRAWIKTTDSGQDPQDALAKFLDDMKNNSV